MAWTNGEIPEAAIRGLNATNGGDTFSTRQEDVRYPFRGFGWHEYSYRGKLSVRDVFDQLQEAGYQVIQSVYSYWTPIAIEVRSPRTGETVWLIWDRSYSTITDCKHKTHLYKLSRGARVEYMPWDATCDDMIGIIEAYVKYVPGKRTGRGSFEKGWRDRD